MDIDQLTVGEVKKLIQVFEGFGLIQAPNSKEIDNKMLGKYVIVRCRDAGVHAGYLESYTGRECVLTAARRLWEHRPLDKALSWYEGVAVSGLDAHSKCSGEVSRRHLTENCDIVRCTKEAEDNIRGFATHGQK